MLRLKELVVGGMCLHIEGRCGGRDTSERRRDDKISREEK